MLRPRGFASHSPAPPGAFSALALTPFCVFFGHVPIIVPSRFFCPPTEAPRTPLPPVVLPPPCPRVFGPRCSVFTACSCRRVASAVACRRARCAVVRVTGLVPAPHYPSTNSACPLALCLSVCFVAHPPNRLALPSCRCFCLRLDPVFLGLAAVSVFTACSCRRVASAVARRLPRRSPSLTPLPQAAHLPDARVGIPGMRA